MIDRRQWGLMQHAGFQRDLSRVLATEGWERSAARPKTVVPGTGRFFRLLPSGWAATVEAFLVSPGAGESDDEDQAGSSQIHMAGGVTLPAAERLAALLKYPVPELTLEMAGADGVVESLASAKRGDASIFAEILRCAEDVVIPWAHEHATPEAWLDGHSQMRTDNPVSFHGEFAPVMLVASGRPDEALEHLRRAERAPEFSDGDFSLEFAGRIREFVESGAAIPEDGEALFPYYPPDDFDVADRHDAQHEAFTRAMNAELKAASARARWSHIGGLGLKAMRGMARYRRPSDPDMLEERWRTVTLDAATDDILDRAFDRARTLVDHEVEIDVDVAPPSSGSGDPAVVLVGGRRVGVFRADQLPEDVYEMPSGRVVARLTRKPRAPRHLLELRLLTDEGR